MKLILRFQVVLAGSQWTKRHLLFLDGPQLTRRPPSPPNLIINPIKHMQTIPPWYIMPSLVPLCPVKVEIFQKKKANGEMGEKFPIFWVKWKGKVRDNQSPLQLYRLWPVRFIKFVNRCFKGFVSFLFWIVIILSWLPVVLRTVAYYVGMVT